MVLYKQYFLTIKPPMTLIEPHWWFVFGTAFLSVCYVGCLICPQYIEIEQGMIAISVEAENSAFGK